MSRAQSYDQRSDTITQSHNQKKLLLAHSHNQHQKHENHTLGLRESQSRENERRE